MAPPSQQAQAGAPRTAAGRGLRVQSTRLARVSLRNFKGHKDLRLDMGGITVLMGPTSSGKSTVLQALSLLRSALKAGSFGMLRGGSPEHGRFADIVAGGDEGLDVGIGIGGRRTVGAGEDGGGGMAADFSYDVSFGSSLSPSMVRATADVGRDPPAPQGEGGLRVEHAYGRGANATTVSGTGIAGDLTASARAGGGLAPRIDADLAKGPMAGTFRRMFGNGRFFRSLLDGLWHVPFSGAAAPGAPMPERSGGAVPPNRAQGVPPPAGRMGAGRPIPAGVSEMLREMGLGSMAAGTVRLPAGGGPAPALDFVGAGALRPAARGASGPGRLVGMLAALACSPRGAVVTIEEPEIHLDPAAQARLMGILVRQATEEKKQIVFTTYSDHLLYPLLAYVEKAGHPLECGDVAMHYFSADESGRPAGAERLFINEHGQIPGGLRGFWNADGKAMREIVG